jgi:hypothetical protein
VEPIGGEYAEVAVGVVYHRDPPNIVLEHLGQGGAQGRSHMGLGRKFLDMGSHLTIPPWF